MACSTRRDPVPSPGRDADKPRDRLLGPSPRFPRVPVCGGRDRGDAAHFGAHGADTPALAMGDFYFNNEPNLLDQCLVNKNMATQTAPIRAKAETVELLRFPGTSAPASTHDRSRSAEWAKPSTRMAFPTTSRSAYKSPKPVSPRL